MRVLMLGWELPPHNSGGLGVACLGLARSLSKKGVHVTFVLPKRVDVDYDFMDVVFANIDEDGLLTPQAYSTQCSWLATGMSIDQFPPDYARASIKFAQKIAKIAKKFNADLIHAHDWMTYAAGIAAKKALNKPLIVHIHNTVFDRGAGNANPYEYAIEKHGFEEADKIISVSDFTKKILVDRYNINPNKINVVHNGIEMSRKEKLSPALKALKELGYKVVLSLGRITIQKGVDYFINAAKKVLEYNPKVIFIVVGSGDMQEQVMTQAAQLGILDKVIFTGFLRGKEVDRIYQTADLFVMSSVSEPFGIVPLEAIANGTPVLISKQSGVSEVLNHALKVDFWDTDEMANKIIGVLENPALGSDLTKESNKELPNINWNNAADKCIGVYNSLIV